MFLRVIYDKALEIRQQVSNYVKSATAKKPVTVDVASKPPQVAPVASMQVSSGGVTLDDCLEHIKKIEIESRNWETDFEKIDLEFAAEVEKLGIVLQEYQQTIMAFKSPACVDGVDAYIKQRMKESLESKLELFTVLSQSTSIDELKRLLSDMGRLKDVDFIPKADEVGEQLIKESLTAIEMKLQELNDQPVTGRLITVFREKKDVYIKACEDELKFITDKILQLPDSNENSDLKHRQWPTKKKKLMDAMPTPVLVESEHQKCIQHIEDLKRCQQTLMQLSSAYSAYKTALSDKKQIKKTLKEVKQEIQFDENKKALRKKVKAVIPSFWSRHKGKIIGFGIGALLVAGGVAATILTGGLAPLLMAVGGSVLYASLIIAGTGVSILAATTTAGHLFDVRKVNKKVVESVPEDVPSRPAPSVSKPLSPVVPFRTHQVTYAPSVQQQTQQPQPQPPPTDDPAIAAIKAAALKAISDSEKERQKQSQQQLARTLSPKAPVEEEPPFIVSCPPSPDSSDSESDFESSDNDSDDDSEYENKPLPDRASTATINAALTPLALGSAHSARLEASAPPPELPTLPEAPLAPQGEPVVTKPKTFDAILAEMKAKRLLSEALASQPVQPVVTTLFTPPVQPPVPKTPPAEKKKPNLKPRTIVL